MSATSTKVLFVISSDPRKSGRPAEAVRMAAGVGAWKKVQVSLFLQNSAALILSEHPDDLHDEQHLRNFLPDIAQAGGQVLVEKNSPFLAMLGNSSIPFEEVNVEQVAQVSADSRYTLRF